MKTYASTLRPEDTPDGERKLYAIAAVHVVEAPNARSAFEHFVKHTPVAHAVSNTHAITPAMMDPDWTIELTYGATKLAPIPADEEEQR